MTQDEYLAERSRLGQLLRDVRDERRMLRSMFKDTRNPELISAYLDWCQLMVNMDMHLSSKIYRLDKEWEQWKI